MYNLIAIILIAFALNEMYASDRHIMISLYFDKRSRAKTRKTRCDITKRSMYEKNVTPTIIIRFHCQVTIETNDHMSWFMFIGLSVSLGAINDNTWFESNMEQSCRSPREIRRRGSRRGSRRSTSSQRLLPPEERRVYLFSRKCRFVPRSPRLLTVAVASAGPRNPANVFSGMPSPRVENICCRAYAAFSGVGRFISRILTDAVSASGRITSAWCVD